MALPRLRQVAFAATDLASVADELRTALRLDEPFRDPGVGHFGLHNAVFTVGDTFLEVVSPVRDGTAAGRYLARQGGDCGYMAMVQVADTNGMAGTRRRLAELGVRVVFDHAEPDIADLHLHPRDVPGTLLALDAARPEGSWRWGGPTWTAAVPPHQPGGLRGLVVAVEEPDATASRWAAVIGAPAAGSTVRLEGADIDFVASDGRDGIVGLTVAGPDLSPSTVEIAGVRLDLMAA